MALAPVIVSIAKQVNAKAIIYHTKRRGFKRMLNQFNFKLLTKTAGGEYVFKWVLNG